MKIKMKHDLFLKESSNLSASNVLLVDDGVILEVDYKSIKYLKEKNIDYERLDFSLNKILKFRIGFVLGLILFCFILFINNERITKIEFNKEYPINDDIKYYLEERMKHIGPLSFLDINLQDCNLELRGKYIGYEWISVNKVGNKILVNISDVEEKLIDNDIQKGNIISNKTGIIKEYIIYSGSHNLEYNQYVKQGDVLVLGNGLEARALILGDTYEERTIKIKKQITDDRYTGKIDFYEELSIFQNVFSFHKNNEYKRSVKEEKSIFSLGFIKYNHIQEKEKCDIITIYDYNDACSYAESIIYDDFNQNKKYDKEYIKQIGLLYHSEDEEYFYFTYLINKYENFGEFIKE